MIYKLVSRDNIESDILESWPAVLNNPFNRFNNRVEPQCFHTEDDIMNWLECKSRSKSQNRYTMTQTFKNGDPNKLYSVYRCVHDNPNHGVELKDAYMYSLRFKKPFEAHMTFRTEKGTRNNSSFKKINVLPEIEEDVDYSSDIREIKNELFEGIYPIDGNENDPIDSEYMKYVANVHEEDEEENKDREYVIVIADTNHVSHWLENFLRKLSMVEKYLRFYANQRVNNNIKNIISLNQDDDHDVMIQYIVTLMDEHRQNTLEDTITQTKVKNLVMDPFLFTGSVYQIRHNGTLLTWHMNYGYILEKYQIVPSKEFANIILNFDLSNFYKQYQHRENLEQIILNLEKLYGINSDPRRSVLREGRLEFGFDQGRFVGPPSKFHKITKKFT